MKKKVWATTYVDLSLTMIIHESISAASKHIWVRGKGIYFKLDHKAGAFYDWFAMNVFSFSQDKASIVVRNGKSYEKGAKPHSSWEFQYK